MNLNSDNGGNYWLSFTTAVMINEFNYCAENISAVSKSGIANPGGRKYNGDEKTEFGNVGHLYNIRFKYSF